MVGATFPRPAVMSDYSSTHQTRSSLNYRVQCWPETRRSQCRDCSSGQSGTVLDR